MMITYKFILIEYDDSAALVTDRFIYDVDITNSIDDRCIENLLYEVEGGYTYNLRSNSFYLYLNEHSQYTTDITYNNPTPKIFGKFIKIYVNNNLFLKGKIVNIKYSGDKHYYILKLDCVDKLFYNKMITFVNDERLIRNRGDYPAYFDKYSREYNLSNLLFELIRAYNYKVQGIGLNSNAAIKENNYNHLNTNISDYNKITPKSFAYNYIMFNSFNNRALDEDTNQIYKIEHHRLIEETNKSENLGTNYYYDNGATYADDGNGYTSKKYYLLNYLNTDPLKIIDKITEYDHVYYGSKENDLYLDYKNIYIRRHIKEPSDEDKSFFQEILTSYFSQSSIAGKVFDNLDLSIFQLAKDGDNYYCSFSVDLTMDDESGIERSNKYLFHFQPNNTFDTLRFNYKDTPISTIIKDISFALNGYLALLPDNTLYFQDLTTINDKIYLDTKYIEEISREILKVSPDFSISSSFYIHPKQKNFVEINQKEAYNNTIIQRTITYKKYIKVNVFDEIYIDNKQSGLIKTIQYKPTGETIITTTNINLISQRAFPETIDFPNPFN